MNRLARSRGMRGRGGHEHIAIGVGENALEALDELRKEGVGDIGNDQAVGAASAIFQSRGAAVGDEFEFIDDALHALGSGWFNCFQPIDDTRDGRARYASKLCDVAHVHEFSLMGGDAAACPQSLDRYSNTYNTGLFPASLWQESARDGLQRAAIQ